MTERKILDILSEQIRREGPIPTARISVARARGNARNYRYVGVVRYQVRLGRDGLPTSVPQGRAASDRRSERLAQKDLERLCESEGRTPFQAIGRLSGSDALVLIKDRAAAYDILLSCAVLCPDDRFAANALKEWKNGNI